MAKKMIRTKVRASLALAKLRKYVAGNHGGMTEVVNRFNEITGGDTKRQQIERVLTPNDDKRVEPRFGAGLALMQIQQELCK